LFGSEIDLDGDSVAIAARGGVAYLFTFREQDGRWREVDRVAEADPDRTLETHVAYGGGVLALGRIGYDENGIDLPGRSISISVAAQTTGCIGSRGCGRVTVFVAIASVQASPWKMACSSSAHRLLRTAIRDRTILVGAPTADLPQ